MKQTAQNLFRILALCALLAGLSGHVASARTPFTAFSVQVLQGDSFNGIAGATVTIGTVSKATNANGVAVFNLYFNENEEKSINVSKGSRRGSGKVSAANEGSTINIRLD